MNRPIKTLCVWTCCAVILCCFSFVLVASAKDSGAKSEKDPKQQAAELVEAIANRNPAPKIVAWPGDWPSKAALFSEDYDWKEEERTRKAIGQLRKNRTEEVWEELVKRSADERYCVIVTSVKTGDAHVEEVGLVCNSFARSRLIGVYWRHLPRSPHKEGEKLILDDGVGNLAKWRKDRAEKTLYELQIEVCMKAIEALEKEKRVPKEERKNARIKIEREIEQLRKTRRPSQIEGGHSFYVGSVYNPDLAKRVRDGIKSGKYEDLGIIK